MHQKDYIRLTFERGTKPLFSKKNKSFLEDIIATYVPLLELNNIV